MESAVLGAMCGCNILILFRYRNHDIEKMAFARGPLSKQLGSGCFDGEKEMNMDHGILNLPLAKRGDINAQLDRYKADQAKAQRAADKARREAFKADKALAKQYLAEIKAAPGLIESKAESISARLAQLLKPAITPKELLKELDGWAKWQPVKLITLYGEWMKPTA